MKGCAAPGSTEMSDDKDKSGCLACFLFAAVLVVLDSFGLCLSVAAPTGYGPLVMVLGVVGFGCGVALGIYFRQRSYRRPPGHRITG